MRSNASASAKHVGLWWGYRYMDWHTLGGLHVGTPRTARETGLSASTVKRAVLELKTAGWLVLVKRGHTGVASEYRGAFPSKATKPEAEPPAVFQCAHCGRMDSEPSETRPLLCTSCAA